MAQKPIPERKAGANTQTVIHPHDSVNERHQQGAEQIANSDGKGDS